MILDVEVTGIDGRSSTSDDNLDSLPNYRYDQKITKYAKVAEENGFQIIPANFFHTVQITRLSDWLETRYGINWYSLRAKPSNL